MIQMTFDVSSSDHELQAIEVAVTAINNLDPEARARVARYISDRFEA